MSVLCRGANVVPNSEKMQKSVRYKQVVPNKVWQQNFGRCCYHRHTTLKRENAAIR